MGFVGIGMEGVRSEALRGGIDLAKANFCICCEARRRCCPGTVTGGASSGSIECRRHLGDARFVYDDHADAVRGLGTHSSMALAMMVCAMAMGDAKASAAAVATADARKVRSFMKCLLLESRWFIE